VEFVQAFMQRMERHKYLRCPHCGTGCFVPTATIVAVPLRLAPRRGSPGNGSALPLSVAVPSVPSLTADALARRRRFEGFQRSYLHALPLLQRFHMRA
jgi:hypothetical protein